MRLWQQTMIGLARSEAATNFMQGSRLMSRFSSQFTGGKDVREATDRAREMFMQGITSSLFVLGEYEDKEENATAMVQELEAILPLLVERGIDPHISVDPTQIGSMVSWDLCRKNAARLGQAVKDIESDRRKVLMVDMEDSSVTQNTLDLYYELGKQQVPTAITIQAYLKRSKKDIERIVASGGMVRLVKGAFAENKDIALTSRTDIDQSYRELVDLLFSEQARKTGVYPVIGSHDHNMIEFTTNLARERGWNKDQWEVEMLLGVRPDYQQKLVQQGVSVRVYLPYGEKWWPYSVRRIGENPRNLWFVLRSILKV